MKKNFFKWLSILVMAALCIGFASCGDDEDVKPGGDSGSGGTDSGVEGKFQGPKRVFGNNLLTSYGGGSTTWELTYDANDFVTKIKSGSYEYEVSYSGNQVIVNYKWPIGSEIAQRQYTFTIGSNGFAESYSTNAKNKNTVVKFEYNTNGHLTKIRAYEDGPDKPATWIGTFTWQDGNLTKANDNDSWSYKSQIYNYGSISNVAGLFIRAAVGGDIGDFYEDEFHYIGLLGKSTANLVQSYSRTDNNNTNENTWTLDDAGRPIKCVTTTTESGSTRTYNYFWRYR